MEQFNDYINDSEKHAQKEESSESAIAHHDSEKEVNPARESDTEHHEYQWYEDEYAPVMSGTISEDKALSIYRPKPKRHFFRNPIVLAVLSSVLTVVVCFCMFFLFLGRAGNMQLNKPAGNVLNIAGTPATVTPENNAGAENVVAQSGSVMAVPDIYDKVSPAVVSIIVTSQGNNNYLQSSAATSSGSGVILTADGYIVTNNHVVDGASIITVKTVANQTFDAQIVGKDARTDLAILKVQTEQELPFAELGDSSVLRVGDMAIAIGNPLQEALESTLTVGYISAINRTMVIEDRQMTMLQTDAAINPGNSGGALINIYGQVIGINTAKSTGYDIEGLGFAIPINEAIPVIESIIEHGYVKGRPLVGITGINVTESIAKANRIPVGVYVQSVIEGGAAEQGGIQPGDVILKFKGQEITSIDNINEIRDECKVGDQVAVEVSRNGEIKTFTITLQEEQPIEEIPRTSAPKQDANPGAQQYPSDFFDWFGW